MGRATGHEDEAGFAGGLDGPMGLAADRSVATTSMLCGLFVALIGYLSTSSYARKEMAAGELVPKSGALSIVAPQGGFVREIFVRDGDVVTSSTPIARLSFNGSLDDGVVLIDVLSRIGATQEEALAEKISASVAQLDARLSEINVQRDALRGQIELLNEQLTAHEGRQRLARETLAGFQSLYDKGLMSSVLLHQQEDLALQSGIEISQVNSQIIEAKNQLTRLATQVSEVGSTRAREEAEFKIATAQIHERNAQSKRQDAVVLVAERAGTIDSADVQLGEFVPQGTVIANVLPLDSTLEGRVLIPSKAVAFVSPGTRVRIMYDSFPFQKFGVSYGTVISLSDLSSEMPGQASEDGPDEYYVAKIELDNDHILAEGRHVSLRPGMKFNVDLILEDRSLISWILDPIWAFGKRN